jgi:hypothetical protein
VIEVGLNSQVLMGGYESPTATFYRAPAAIVGDVPRVRLAVEVLTGLEMGDDGTVRELAPAVWQRRRQQLEGQGGSPFVVPVPSGEKSPG